MIVPDTVSRKKCYRFRGGLIEKFAVVADAAYHDMDQREREREKCRSFYTPVNALVTECFLSASLIRYKRAQ